MIDKKEALALMDAHMRPIQDKLDKASEQLMDAFLAHQEKIIRRAIMAYGLGNFYLEVGPLKSEEVRPGVVTCMQQVEAKPLADREDG